MDCDYVCLNNISSVHPAIRQQGQIVIACDFRTSDQPILPNGLGHESQYHLNAQCLSLHSTNASDPQTPDDSVNYYTLLTHRYDDDTVTNFTQIISNKTTLQPEESIESETFHYNSKEEIYYSGAQKQQTINTNLDISQILDSNSEESKSSEIAKPEMPYYKTHSDAISCENTTHNNETHIFVPSLDLTSITMDDETETRPKKEPSKPIAKEESQQSTTNPPQIGGTVGTGGGVTLFRKQKMPFVFPSEKSFQDIDVMRGNPTMTQFDDQYYITSVSSYRTNSGVNDHAGEKDPDVPFEDGTISFSLSNPNVGKYIVDENAPKHHMKDNANCVGQAANVSNNSEKTKVNKSTASPSGGNVKNASNSYNHGAIKNAEVVKTSGLQVYDVIIVNGNHQYDNNEVAGSVEEEESHVAIDAEGDKSQCKPKSKVTFSFADSETASGRYTPLKGDVRVQLQSVLKKRRTPSPVVQRSSSEDRAGSRKKRAQIANKDSVRLFGSSYTLDYRFGCNNNGTTVEYGIPVKNVHTTSTDLEKRHSKPETPTTNMADKPPIPSTANRITLSMAERSATNGSVRGMPNRESRLSASHMRGRMAYFRPAEKGRSAPSQTTRSRSSDDLHSDQNRSNYTQPNSSSSRNSRNTSTLSFTLRRCASSERDILVTDGNSRNQHRPKPKVAFGSFILPKETSTRIKPAHVQFHELNAAQGNLPLGSYIHSHTRRSPYAPPTQVLLSDNRKQELVSRRPGTGNNQTRYLQNQQQQPQYSRQAAQSTRSHAQRHSAPSSFGSGNVKERTSGSSPHPDRITINTSPAKSQNLRQANSGNNATMSVSKPHDVIPSSKKSFAPNGSKIVKNNQGMIGAGTNAGIGANQRPNITQPNKIATRERGASHHRFISTLQSFTNGES